MKFSDHELRNQDKLTTGLVANGTTGSWDADVDEVNAQWFLQIEGPSIYINFQINTLEIINELIGFLQKHLATVGEVAIESVESNEELRVGHFGRTPVSFLWDAEGEGRCVMLIAGSGESKARLTLLRSDVCELLSALRQVRDDLAE